MEEATNELMGFSGWVWYQIYTGSYAKYLAQIRRYKANVRTPRNEIYARLRSTDPEEKRKLIHYDNGTRTSAGFEYIQGKIPILRLKSRLLKSNLEKQAVKANRNNRYFCTESKKEYETSLIEATEDLDKDPKDRQVIILPSRKNFTMSDKENWEILESILKDQAKSYFYFHGPIPITCYLVDQSTVDAKDGTLLTQMWLWNRYGTGLDFYGNDRILDERVIFDGKGWYPNINYWADEYMHEEYLKSLNR